MPKRIVEYPSRGWRQIEVEYEEGQFIDELERSIRLLEGDLVEVEGESSYEGWQRLVINVSPVLEEEEEEVDSISGKSRAQLYADAGLAGGE